jgi:hypothetical protein
MDSLQELLGKYGPPKPPDEVAALKRYITDEFSAACTIGVQGEALVVTVGSASLANTLRLRITTIQAAVETKKRLIFRIG